MRKGNGWIIRQSFLLLTGLSAALCPSLPGALPHDAAEGDSELVGDIFENNDEKGGDGLHG